MGDKSFLPVPMLLQYLLPALLLMLLINPILDGKLEKEGQAVVALLLSLMFIPTFQSFSYSLVRIDRLFKPLQKYVGWYKRNCDFQRALALADKDERESMESAYALVRFYNTSAVMLMLYAGFLICYGLLNTACIDLSAEFLKVPFLVSGLRVPVVFLAMAMLVFSWLLHLQFLGRFQEYYGELVPELAMRVEARRGRVVLAFCGQLLITAERQDKQDSRGEEITPSIPVILKKAFLNRFKRPGIEKITGNGEGKLTEERQQLKVKVSLTLGAEIKEYRLDVDEYGRYADKEVPRSLSPYSLTLEPSSWCSKTWKQHYEDKHAVYGQSPKLILHIARSETATNAATKP